MCCCLLFCCGFEFGLVWFGLFTYLLLCLVANWCVLWFILIDGLLIVFCYVYLCSGFVDCCFDNLIAGCWWFVVLLITCAYWFWCVVWCLPCCLLFVLLCWCCYCWYLLVVRCLNGIVAFVAYGFVLGFTGADCLPVVLFWSWAYDLLVWWTDGCLLLKWFLGWLLLIGMWVLISYFCL